MTDLNTIKTNVALTNKNLARATEKIYRLADSMRKSAYETAVTIANVEINQWYLDDGFEDVHAWTAKMFGFKKSASYNLLKIGKEWSREILSESGKVIGYRSALTEEDAPVDFTTSQVTLLLPEGFEHAQELVESEVITPEMTCEEIRRTLKDLKKKDKEEETEAEEAAAETETEAEEAEQEGVTFVLVIDKQGKQYLVPDSILAEYAI